jgi:hypothetical protein
VGPDYLREAAAAGGSRSRMRSSLCNRLSAGLSRTFIPLATCRLEGGARQEKPPVFTGNLPILRVWPVLPSVAFHPRRPTPAVGNCFVFGLGCSPGADFPASVKPPPLHPLRQSLRKFNAVFPIPTVVSYAAAHSVSQAKLPSSLVSSAGRSSGTPDRSRDRD